MLYNIIISLVFTIFIELSVSIFCGIRNKNDIMYIILINIITNPSTEFINILIKDSSFHYLIIIIIEIIVVIIEYLFYRKVLKTKNTNLLYLSIINNICSYVVGLLANLGGLIWKKILKNYHYYF